MLCQSLLLVLVAVSARVAALWPQPAYFSEGPQAVKLAPNVSFTTSTPFDPQIEALLQPAISRCQDLLYDGFIPWMFVIPGESFEPNLTSARTVQQVVLSQVQSSQTDRTDQDESYRLNITVSGEVNISAASSLGFMHGLSTLSQLFYTHSDGISVYTRSAPVSIVDQPAFRWRGVNVDVARNYLTLRSIKKIINVMSWNKMNRLHFHVTDSQSWPLEIPSMPELSRKGAFAPSLVYNTTVFQFIQEYARRRGVEVVAEIDLPGHTASIAKAYPELITGYNVQTNKFADSTSGSPAVSTTGWNTYCAEPPCGQLKLGSKDVIEFLERLLGDVLPRVKNYTSYFHAGGDEVNKNVYLLQHGLNTNETKVLQPLVSDLILQVHNRIRSHGLVPIAWEEMLLDWDIKLQKDVLIQSWISQEAVKKIVGQGYKVIAGSSSATYLDCGKGQWLDFVTASVPYQVSQGFVDYCTPFKNWKAIYHYDPLFNLTAQEVPFVEGFEVHAWGEQIDGANIETMLWPRAAAAAEVGWNGTVTSPMSSVGNVSQPNTARSLEDVGRRLSEWRERMFHRGVHVEPIHSLWCTQRPGQCSL